MICSSPSMAASGIQGELELSPEQPRAIAFGFIMDNVTELKWDFENYLKEKEIRKFFHGKKE